MGTKKEPQNKILERIEVIANENGLTAREAVMAVGYPSSTWYSWRQRGKTPPVKFITAFCQKYNVSLEEVLYDEEDRYKKGATDEKVQILARHLSKIPEEQREAIYDHFAQTIAIYLAGKK